MQNTLYYGDNLEILRNYIEESSVDLIYLDPPFNSKADYNILYKEPTGDPSEAQITAFEDTWHWTEETERTFQEIVKTAPSSVVEIGVFITLEQPTRQMQEEAIKKGFYKLDILNKDFPKIQILTIEEILNGIKPQIPYQIFPHKKAVTEDTSEEQRLDF